MNWAPAIRPMKESLPVASLADEGQKAWPSLKPRQTLPQSPKGIDIYSQRHSESLEVVPSLTQANCLVYSKNSPVLTGL